MADIGMIERRTITIREDIARRWAAATRHLRAHEADQLWQELMVEWLKPTAVNQSYWNNLLDRRMAVLERKQQRTVNDIEFDNTHGDINQ